MTPVVLITGFLGSGKTTLLNALLATRRAGQQKFAIVVNEFGEIGIDGALLPSALTRQVELPGGCICCALDEDLEKTLIGLTTEQPDLECIWVETTGIAEPLPISWTLDRDSLNQRVRLAAVVTVVDALEHERSRPLSPSVDTQVEYADILAISKTDLVDDAARRQLIASLRERNEVAPTLGGDAGEIADQLWHMLEDPSARSGRAAVTQPPSPRHVDFQSLSFAIDGVLDLEELGEHIEALPPAFVRIKGIALAVDRSSGSDEAQWTAFHRVGARFSAEPSVESEPIVVAIGREITVGPLAACISAAVLPSKP